MGWDEATHQSDGASGRGLVLALLAEEEQTLAGLAGPCGDVVVLEQTRELLGVDSLGAEPEELLGVEEVPSERLATCPNSASHLVPEVLPHTWGSCCPCARVGRPRRARPPSWPPQQLVRPRPRPRRQGSQWLAPLSPRRLQVHGQQTLSTITGMTGAVGFVITYRQEQSPP
jgi:hypothetical protein